MQFRWVWSVQSVAYIGILLGLTIWGGVFAASPCAAGDFDAQVRCLLAGEMLTRAEIKNLSAVFRDLQDTLQTKWPGSEVYALGSFVTGLASKSSDADCMAKVPHHDITSDRQLVLKTAHLLKLQPTLYEQVTTKVHANRRIPLLKFIYVPTKRNCDVNFISNLGLENSQMMGYYFSLDDKFLSLAAILKLWSKVQELRSSKILASNTLNLLIIFYLQQAKIAPSFYLLQKHLIRCPVNDWETSFERIPYNSSKKFSLYQLLEGFFKYYSDFNFDDYVLSPFLGLPILKSQFKNIDSLPNELYLYKKYVRKPTSKPLVADTKLCIQDAIELRRNVANISEEKAFVLLSHIRFAAKIFDIIPSSKILRVLLNKHVKLFKNEFRTNATMSEVERLKSCFNETVFLNKL